MNSFHLTVADGVAQLLFDTPDEKVNTFSEARLRELERILAELDGRPDIKALVVRSAKKDVFVAGADIKEFASLGDPDRARAAARLGQTVFQRLADLPYPTFAVIDGACAGGGCEFALACDFRIATDNPKTRIGLPEVNLGILPGWGGTQRLPRLVGFSKALEMVLGAKMLDARKAHKAGLVDRVCAAPFLTETVKKFVGERLPGGKSRAGLGRRASPLQKILDGTMAGRWLVSRKARSAVMAKTGGNLPGPLLALDLMAAAAAGTRLEDGLLREAEAFSGLPGTSQSRSLVRTFFATEEARKAAVSPNAKPEKIETAGVLGAGIMGGGIAWAFSAAGLHVRMRDLNADALGRGYGAAMDANRRLAKKGRLAETELRLRMHRIEGTLGWEGYDACGLVVEAVLEDLDVKRKVLAEAESHVGPDCVIATNTSSLRLSDMESALRHPERFVGLHFFNPVPMMPLVEVVRGPSSSPEAVEAAMRFARSLGKTPILVGDCAGFLVNRILLPYVNEAAKILAEGSDIATIDRLVREHGMPMGPFQLADAVGIDVGYKVAKVLHHAYGERMSVSPLLAEVHDGLKLRGDKAGEGFWIGRGKDRRPNPKVAELAEAKRGGEGRRIPSEEILDRCLLTMVGESARCLQEGVVASGSLLDLAMVMGTGYPAWRGGPVQEGRTRGAAAIRVRLDELAGTLGERFAPHGSLERLDV